MTFCYNIDKAPYLNYTVVNKDGHILRTLDLNLPKAIMMHDFSITKNFTIFMDLPLQFTPENMAKKMNGGAFAFNSTAPARFGILPRHAIKAEEMIWFDVGCCSVFHVVNSYETLIFQSSTGIMEKVVVVQGCRFQKIDLFNMSVEGEAEKDYNELYEWRLNMETGQVDYEGPIVKSGKKKNNNKEEEDEEEEDENENEVEDSTCSGDFPIINPTYLGREQQYCWLSRFSPENNAKFDGIIKIDCQNGLVMNTFVYGNNKRGGEIQFVLKENARKEDDGYLVGFVHDDVSGSSTFWIIDALTMNSVPLCILEMPRRVPYGFHSLYVTEKELIDAEISFQSTSSKL